MSGSEAAFAYHEPPIATILNQTGLLLALNLINTCLDKLLYCGLIGQLFIGILWGTPGAQWLNRDVETVIQQLGYAGLIMLIYEGGLSTSLASLRANLYLSLGVAITGIGVPMGLSFILMELASATPLQAFAAGAALSATSLGTTFTILSTTGLITTRLGTVTTSAAMLDDVVGLVMVQIITNLGENSDSFSAVTVIRPVFVSVGVAVGLVLACRVCLKPILMALFARTEKMPKFLATPYFAFLAYTCILIGLVAGATYAGTSSLFAAYLAGVITSWIDELSRRANVGKRPTSPSSRPKQEETGSGAIRQGLDEPSQPRVSSQGPHKEITGMLIYERYYQQPVQRILIPLFFASIGFAIPITEMFHGSIVWRGFVYAILMTLGKAITGVWLVRFSSRPNLGTLARILRIPFSSATSCVRPHNSSSRKENVNNPAQTNLNGEASATESRTSQPQHSDSAKQDENVAPLSENVASQDNPGAPAASSVSLPPKPKSLYPASILGLAMVARGEIGYLIASLAESRGIFSDSTTTGSSEMYLIIIWAISLCTLIGPICVGTLVRRVKTLQQSRVNSGGLDPLGVWGI